MVHSVRVIVGVAIVLLGVVLIASMMGAWLGLAVVVIGIGVLVADAAATGGCARIEPPAPRPPAVYDCRDPRLRQSHPFNPKASQTQNDQYVQTHDTVKSVIAKKIRA